MKRVIALVAGTVIVAAFAVPLFAHGPGWGRGHHTMGRWGSGPEYRWQYERDYGNLTEEQRNRLEQLDRTFYNETADLRNEIWAKASELNTVLNSPNPDPQKVKSLQREISDLRATLDEKRLSYELEARKITPEQRSGRGYGRDYYGHHMGGYGPHMGYGWHGEGYGPGSCWN